VAIAGAIYAAWLHYIEPPDVFDVLYSIKAIVMVLARGAGSVFGPLFGAVLFLYARGTGVAQVPRVHTGVLGLLIVLLVMFLPERMLTFLGSGCRGLRSHARLLELSGVIRRFGGLLAGQRRHAVCRIRSPSRNIG